jgi:hypothetical protein
MIQEPEKCLKKNSNNSDRIIPNLLKPRSFEGILDMKYSLSEIILPLRTTARGLFDYQKEDVVANAIKVCFYFFYNFIARREKC